MSGARSSRGRAGLKYLVMALAYLVSAVTARPDLTVTNAAGVRAGITGIVYHRSDNSIGVDYAVTDPTGTNVTTFVIQSNADLTAVTAWTNYSGILTVTGNISSEISDFATPPKKFYRMQLINFQ